MDFNITSSGGEEESDGQTAALCRKLLGLVRTCCLDLGCNTVVKMCLAFLSLKALIHST